MTSCPEVIRRTLKDGIVGALSPERSLPVLSLPAFLRRSEGWRKQALSPAKPVCYGCGLCNVVGLAAFEPADTFEAVLFGAIRVLLEEADFAGAALTRLDFLAAAGFAAPRLTAVGPFRAGEALDETLEGGLRRALATAVGRI